MYMKVPWQKSSLQKDFHWGIVRPGALLSVTGWMERTAVRTPRLKSNFLHSIGRSLVVGPMQQFNDLGTAKNPNVVLEVPRGRVFYQMGFPNLQGLTSILSRLGYGHN